MQDDALRQALANDALRSALAIQRDASGRPLNARPRDGLGRPLPRGSSGVARVPEELRELVERRDLDRARA